MTASWFDGQPAAPADTGARTILVCRPQQIREAAVLLTCVPSDSPTPLIVLEPPPATQAEYRSLYEAYRNIADARDLVRGAELARRELRDGKLAQPPDDGLVDACAEQLTPYRQWVKHQRFVARLIEQLAPRRAIFLFSPEHDDTHFIEPLPLRRLSDEQHAIVPDAIERLYFLPRDPAASSPEVAKTQRYTTFAELADTAWEVLRGQPSARENALEIAEYDGRAYLTGLYRALQANVALRPVRTAGSSGGLGDAGHALPASSYCDPASGEPHEAVLVELEHDAERLLGVLYARQRRARLIVCTPPDGAVVEAARAAVERRNAPAIVPAGISDEERIAAVKAALFSDDAPAALLALETAVSTGVPDEVILAVGDLPLTVLTSSTPYHFVAKAGVSWAEKPIGHVTGDATLLLLAELFPGPANESTGFNLLFDPGYFTTAETHDVLSELRERISYSLLLDGNAGSSLALTHLAPALPIDLLFFNTHGSDNGIKLIDLPLPLPAYKVVQRTTLGSRPLVFNNSCSSWVGVGREFVRAGASGYIGTLWNVRAAEAAAYAKSVIGSLIHANVPMSVAMRNTGVADARAYIFVGTAAAKLSSKKPGDTSGAPASLLSAALYLLGAVASLLERTGGTVTNPFVNALRDLMVTESETQLERVDATLPTSDGRRVEAALLQMRVYAALVVRDDAQTPRAHEFFMRWRSIIAALPDARARSSSKARLYHFASRIPACRGQWDEAVAVLEQSIAAAKDAGETAAPQYLELCDVLKSAGRYASAREALARAAHILGSDPAYDGSELFGRQTQIALFFGEFGDALRYAEHGFARALANDDLWEQASFKQDATSAHLGLKEYERSLVTAREAVDLARLAYDDGLELGAYGLLTIALMHNARLPEAQDKAQRGLQWAQQLGNRIEVASFLKDLGDIALGADEPLPALRYWRRAAATFAREGRPRQETPLLEQAKRAALALGTWDARIEYLTIALEIVDDLEPAQRTSVCGDFVSGLQDAVGESGYADLRDGLAELRAEAERIAAARGGGVCEELEFMRYVATTFDDYASGRQTAAPVRVKP